MVENKIYLKNGLLSCLAFISIIMQIKYDSGYIIPNISNKFEVVMNGVDEILFKS